MADTEPVATLLRIDLATTPDFDLGALRICPARRQVCHEDECRGLEPRVMKVLVALALARPAVISRDRLIEQCWEGRIVSDDALNRCILALRHLARDFAGLGFSIQTVPRVGYSLIETPLSSTGPVANGLGVSDKTGRQPRLARQRKALAALLGVVALLAAVLLFVLWQATRSAADAGASIAVLPFRNLSPGEPYFAEGISEEILARLAREPAFRVAGRTSSSMFRNAADVREVGRTLNVDYILEGSVRSQAGAVRVNAALVRASDDTRVWAKSFDGNLDEAFAIQDEIGTSVARALSLKLTGIGPKSATRPARGEAYNLYLTARGLIRTRDRNFSQATIELLTQAIRIDPGYAPAWARLSEATSLAATPKGRAAIIAARPVAEAQARRSLALDPNLAEGHAALGVLLGFASPEAQDHLRRAAQLDPNSAETMLWLGIAYKAAGEFDEELAAYRRAHEIDPLWFRPERDLAIALADRGRRRDAETIAKHDEALMARVAWSYGDFSEAVRHWTASLKAKEQAVGGVASSGIAKSRYLTGLAARPPAATIYPPAADIGRGVSIAWLPAAPTPAEWRERTSDAVSDQISHSENLYAAKLMLNANRGQELRAAYDGPAGLLGIRRGQRLRADQLWDVPSVALALRSGGREKQASRLLAEADALIGTIARRGGTPLSFDASAAGVWAVQGQASRALDALERAWRRGWRTIYFTGPLDLADDPAFRGLHGNPRFERLRTQFVEHFRRERVEIEKLAL